MDLLAFAKNIADRIEAQSVRAKVPVAVSVIDIHGNTILQHRMSGAPTFSVELSERKAYTSALIGVRRYRPIRARISAMLATPLASPKNSQASETGSRTDPLKKPPPTSLLCG